MSIDLEALKLGDWSEMKSDAAIARWVFSGVAAHATTKLPGRGQTDSKTKAKIVYVNDWSWMVDLETRDGFESYGATAYFDSKYKLTQIYYAAEKRNVTSKQAVDWEHAKWVFKCSALSGVTLKDHLVGLHFMASNFLAAAEAEHLGAQHPIRRLLRPFTYGTVVRTYSVAFLLSDILSDIIPPPLPCDPEH